MDSKQFKDQFESADQSLKAIQNQLAEGSQAVGYARAALKRAESAWVSLAEKKGADAPPNRVLNSGYAVISALSQGFGGIAKEMHMPGSIFMYAQSANSYLINTAVTATTYMVVETNPLKVETLPPFPYRPADNLATRFREFDS